MDAVLDTYQKTDSFLHRLDPRAKIIVFFGLIFGTVLSSLEEGIVPFLAYFTVLLFLMLLSQVSLLALLKRSCVVLPFAIFIGIFLPFLPRSGVEGNTYFYFAGLKLNQTGTLLFLNISCKAWLSALSMSTLMATTKFTDILKGLEKLYVARIMVLIISFMYRYIFVFLEQIQNTRRTMQSRNFGGSKIWQWNMLAALIASVFIRTYEQSERIYISMLSRGFAGEIHTWNEMKWKWSDVFFLTIMAIVMIGISLRW